MEKVSITRLNPITIEMNADEFTLFIPLMSWALNSISTLQNSADFSKQAPN